MTLRTADVVILSIYLLHGVVLVLVSIVVTSAAPQSLLQNPATNQLPAPLFDMFTQIDMCANQHHAWLFADVDPYRRHTQLYPCVSVPA